MEGNGALWAGVRTGVNAQLSAEKCLWIKYWKDREMRRRENILLVTIVCFWFALYVYIPYQTPYLTALGVSAGAIGTVVGSYGIMQLILRLPVGVMADYAGKHKPFVILGAALTGLACAVRFVFLDGTGFLIGNIISGCGASTWISYMVLFSGYYSRQEQQKATSRAIMACNLGMCLGFVFSTCFYAVTSMRFLCGAGIAAGALGVVLALCVKEESSGKREVSGNSQKGSTEEKTTVKSLLSICANKKLILFSLLALLQQGIQMATAMSFTTQILEELGAGAGFIGCASVFYMIAAVASAQFASTEVCERRGAKFYIPLVFLLTGIYCVLVPVVGNIYVIFLLQAFPGMSTGILLSYLTSESMTEVPKEKSSTAMGFFQAVYAVGMSAFPTIVGSLTEQVNVGLGYAFLAAAAFLGTVVTLVYYRRRAEKKPEKLS